MGKFRPRSKPVEAFQLPYNNYGGKFRHPKLTYHPPVEGVGGPDYGDDYTVVIGKRGERATVNPGDYVIVLPNGLCKVMKASIFEAVYEKD